MTLLEVLQKIVEGYEEIPIRAKKDGKWASYYLSELDDRTVAMWIRDHILPKYIEEAEKDE